MPDDSVPTITPYVAGRHEAATSGRILFSPKHGGPQAPRPAALASCPPARRNLTCSWTGTTVVDTRMCDSGTRRHIGEHKAHRWAHFRDHGAETNAGKRHKGV